jgi:tRNA-dihydrouridine synthase
MSKPFFVLAPMDDVTDVVFRSIVAECYAPDVMFTEFVNVDGLCSAGRPKLIHKLATNPSTDTNTIAQIWGKNPDNYRTVASEIVDMGFAGVDINMGCPQKNEVNNGCCSALINDRTLAGNIIRATQEGAAGRIPVSVKCRLGWNEIDYSWHEYLLGFNLDMLSVHVRTRKEMSDVPAHWDALPQIVAIRDRVSPNTKIVVNGDILDYANGVEVAETSKADGIMIGRGVFKDPYCFDPSSPWPSMTPEQKIRLYMEHIGRFNDTYKNREKSFQSLRKFCKTYIHGFDGATEVREMVMAAPSNQNLLDSLNKYLKT